MDIARNIEKVRSELPEGVSLVAVSKTHPAAAVAEAYRAGQRLFGENRPQEMAAKREALAAMGSGAAGVDAGASNASGVDAVCGGGSDATAATNAAGVDSDAWDVSGVEFADIRWHQIGHLQTNKVKLIAPFVAMIESADSVRLLAEISKQAVALGRVIDVLLEIRIGREDTKSGWEWDELVEWLSGGEFRSLAGVRFRGVMGIATFTDEEAVVRGEFERLAAMHRELRERFFEVDTSGAPDVSGISAADRDVTVSGGGFDVVSMGMSGDYPLAIECGSTMVRVGSAIFGARG